MLEILENTEITNAVIATLILTITQIVKPYIKEKDKIPIVTAIIGFVLSFIATYDAEIIRRIITALFVGLAPAGAYEATIDKIKK